MRPLERFVDGERGMDVLILSQYYPPDMGGGATRAHNMALGLSRLGCRVKVVCAAPHYPKGRIPPHYRWRPIRIENMNGIDVVRTFVPPIESTGTLRRILLFLSFMISSLFAVPIFRRADVVFAANPNIFSVFPGFVYSRICHSPLIQNVDDLWPEVLNDLGLPPQSIVSRIGEALARITYRLANVITPISAAYTETIVRKYGIDTERIRHVPAGVDLSRFQSTAKEERKEFFTVLYIGAFSPTYNFDQIFDAARNLSRIEDIRFVIQGAGELAGYLMGRLQESDLSNVTIVNKVIRREHVADRLSDADALILPLSGLGSIEQGISSKLYEYQAAGRPIICCSRGEPGRYVEASNSGIVVAPGDIEGLSNSILFLRSNPDAAREMGRRGREHVRSSLSVEAVGRKMISVFKDAMASG
jgi:hypothetical protein